MYFEIELDEVKRDVATLDDQVQTYQKQLAERRASRRPGSEERTTGADDAELQASMAESAKLQKTNTELLAELEECRRREAELLRRNEEEREKEAGVDRRRTRPLPCL